MQGRKKINLILILFFGLFAFPYGCSKDNSKYVISEKTEVNSSQFISLSVKGYSLNTKYEGTFGNQKVDIIKTSDSTLSFIIPDVPSGSYALNFELSKLTFNVKQLPVGDPDLITKTIFNNSNLQIEELKKDSSQDIARINEMVQFRKEVIDLFNTLSPEQKKQTAQFYEANKEMFQKFSNSITTNLNGSVVFKTHGQADCPRTSYKVFYSCTAENLGNAARDLKVCTKDFLEWTVYTAVVGKVAWSAAGGGPVAWGLAAVGITLTSGMSYYLLFAEVQPKANLYFSNLWEFMKVNWIFGEAVYLTIEDEFSNNSSTSLKLNPKARAVKITDSDLSNEFNLFISSFNALNSVWNKLSGIFGALPTFKNTEKPLTLNANDVNVSIISNQAKVQIVSQSAGNVTFKTTSTTKESFTYHIKVEKNGFTKEMDVNATINPGGGTGTVMDIDGNVYKTVIIGAQEWMAENLKTSKYRDGSAIPTGLNNTAWENTTSGAYAIYDNNLDNNTYGKLYNWYAATDSRYLCPAGWHTPSEAEFDSLNKYLGGYMVAGGKMKSTTGWNAPNTGADNSSGFSGLPGGGFSPDAGGIFQVGVYAKFWHSSIIGSSGGFQSLDYSNAQSTRSGIPKTTAIAVRCVRD